MTEAGFVALPRRSRTVLLNWLRVMRRKRVRPICTTLGWLVHAAVPPPPPPLEPPGTVPDGEPRPEFPDGVPCSAPILPPPQPTKSPARSGPKRGLMTGDRARFALLSIPSPGRKTLGAGPRQAHAEW